MEDYSNKNNQVSEDFWEYDPDTAMAIGDELTEQLLINAELKKIVARAINMLDMFADKSRGKYADECRTVADELTKRYQETA